MTVFNDGEQKWQCHTPTTAKDGSPNPAFCIPVCEYVIQLKLLQPRLSFTTGDNRSSYPLLVLP